MLFSEAMGRKVVSTDTASTVGQVSDYVVDPRLPGIVALTLSRTSSRGSALPWPNIIAFGVDAVTVPGAAAVVEADQYLAELAGKPHTLLHKRVLTTSGVQLGTVLDVDFDPNLGRLAALILERGPIDAARLLGVGSYAVMMQA
ncbi:MAG TPA: PRC-barrel domain-containing protein [Nakamurella sp.]|nr:PRC-barrel domain-containing protein [Nakamurella sp.]